MADMNRRPVLIACDHGYGQIKTPNFVFPTGVEPCYNDASFVDDVLTWNGQKYAIGIGHKAFQIDKTKDEDFRLLTMAAVARELELRGMTHADVYLAIGLPLDWASDQKQRFHDYMMSPRKQYFSFNGVDYTIYILDVNVYPQGFVAVADHLKNFTGMNMICDIGNGTMSMMFIHSGKPVPGKVYTVTKGVHECVRQMKDAAMKQYRAPLDDLTIEEFFRTGTVDVPADVLRLMDTIAHSYVKEIMSEMYNHGFDPQLMKLHLLGGGVHLVKRFGDKDVLKAIDEGRIILIEDIHATAKGYERMARAELAERGVTVQ